MFLVAAYVQSWVAPPTQPSMPVREVKESVSWKEDGLRAQAYHKTFLGLVPS